MKLHRSLVWAWIAALFGSTLAAAAEPPVYDVVVYGGCAGGVAAAVQARRMQKTVVLIEPGRHLGGLTSGGLGATDIGNKAAIGGVAREFYRRVRKHYDDPAAWRQERPDEYRSGRGSEQAKEDAMWTFEPQTAERILRAMADEADVPLRFGERLDLRRAVEKEGSRIVALRMESGLVVRGRRFIDATYEGDLMALAGVDYHVGREANSVYDETLNGVQTKNAVKHQMQDRVDPYVKPGDPSSGLLPGVVAGPPGEEGSGDRRVQAYCFRMCLTDAPENRLPFEKPADYDPLRYELLLRNFEAGETRTPLSIIRMPNRKSDVNNNYGFSTDNLGMNYAWADADYATREKLFDEHLRYQQGLMWTLVNDPRVPAAVRAEASKWGNCRDEFTATGGWSHQLYVREARRMIGAVVMTQHHCQGRTVARDSVGLAAYTMDSHNVRRYVDADGFARNEGDVQVGGFPPYPIDYGAITPKEPQCDNLLVPVCLSASHIAYGSIRMEPVFMVLGQSAATAACLSIDQQVSVQQVDRVRLRERLQADGQILDWTGPPAPTGLDPRRLPGVVLDDPAARRSGDWTSSSSVGPFVGAGYLHDGGDDQRKKSLEFQTPLAAGRYQVRLAYTPHPNRSPRVLVTVEHAGGKATVEVDQRRAPAIDKLFHPLGSFDFVADRPARVLVQTGQAPGYVVVDAVQFVRE